jgi:hypothetical protein
MLTTIFKTTEQAQPEISGPVEFRKYTQKVLNNIDGQYCESSVFIENQIPFWMKQNYGSDGSDNYFISFIKEYYNWLYCGYKEKDINLTPTDIEVLFDIEQVPDEFLNFYVKTYAPFLSISIIDDENRQYIRGFLKSIKSDFLITKGTEGAYRYILKTIFNVENVNIDYPKKYLTRLNGGKFIDFSWNLNQSIIDLPENFDPRNPIVNDVLAGNRGYDPNTRPNLFGAALNESVLPDDNFWQEYSYILTSDATVEDVITYKDTILDATHPAGMLGFFEQYVPLGESILVSDDPIGGQITTSNAEIPVIGRYLLMYPNLMTEEPNDPCELYPDSCSPETEWWLTFDDQLTCDTLGVNYFCYCCVFSCDPEGGEFNAPQHRLPTWVPAIRNEVRIPNGTLGHMKIESFLEMELQTSSPNTTLVSCNTANNGTSCDECAPL